MGKVFGKLPGVWQLWHSVRGQATAQNAPQYILYELLSRCPSVFYPLINLTSLFPLFPLMKILMGFWGTAGGAGASASPISENTRPYKSILSSVNLSRQHVTGLETW